MMNNAISALDSDKEKEKIERERQEEEVQLQRRFEEEKRIEEMRLKFREQYQPNHSAKKTLITQVPEERGEQGMPHRRFKRTLQTRQKPWKAKSCAYCDSEQHKPINCQQVTTSEARKQLISKKRLCFNCLGANHRA